MSNWSILEFFRTDPGIALLLAGVVLWTLLPVVVLFRVDRRLRRLADELGTTRQALTELNGHVISGRPQEHVPVRKCQRPGDGGEPGPADRQEGGRSIAGTAFRCSQ